MKYQIKTYIRFAGLKRSGNHAVINWVIRHFTGNICFRNNVGSLGRLNNLQCNAIEALTDPERNPVNLDSKCHKSLFLASFEDFDPQDVFRMSMIRDYSKHCNHQLSRFIQIVILRDPFNYYASRLQSERNGMMGGDAKLGDPIQQYYLLYLWKSYAKTFLEFSKYDLPCRIAISYNRWLDCEEYRTGLAKKLGANISNDYAIDKISAWGKGSSFSGTKYVSQAEFVERWKGVAEEPGFKLLLQDRELLELAEKIFGKIGPIAD